MNTDIYAFVALVLQASKALNITIPGCEKYNVPTRNITLNDSNSPPTLVSYSPEAITGSDDFVDGGVTIKDVFDVIVDITRDITPTCMFSSISSRLFVSLTCHQSSWSHLVARVCNKRIFWRCDLTAFFPDILRIIGLFARSSEFPHTPPRS